jgi:uncharacterized integral membrane protein
MDDRRIQQGEAPAPTKERSLGSQIRLWGGLAGAALLLLLLFQNLNRTDVTFLFWEWEVPLVLALIIAAVLGAVAAQVFGYFRRRAKEAELLERAAARRDGDKR